MPETVFGTSLLNGLYIRQEYWDLYGMIMKTLAPNQSIRRILVVGSPGIGKSVFVIFLLLVLMTEKREIANFSYNTTNYYEISNTPREGRKYESLFDGKEDGGALDYGYLNHAFLFASPRTKNYNEFVKENCFKVYMNPWTKAECQGFADAIELEDQDEWLRRFNFVGGKPRFVFSSSTHFDDLVQRVNDEIPHNVDELKARFGFSS